MRNNPAGCSENYVWQGFFCLLGILLLCLVFFNCGDCYVQSSVICYGWMRNTYNRKDTGAFRMKSITEMQVGEYGITAEEIMAADAIKFYLQSMEPAEALKKVAAVYEPKVIWLDSGEGVPVQSIIDGAKYAAFIDEAVRFAVQEVEDSRIIEKLESIDGKHMIESASVEFMSFIEEAYKCLRW